MNQFQECAVVSVTGRRMCIDTFTTQAASEYVYCAVMLGPGNIILLK